MSRVPDGHDLSTALRERRISATELLQETFARVDALNPQINAIVIDLREQALARARRLDDATEFRGPLHGLPVTIKETFAYRGTPSTWGDPALRNDLSTETAPAVQKLEAAGAIVIGKTNVPLMLCDWQSYNDLYGCTTHPLDPTLTAGGSSGGESAAVAAGFSCFGLGSDIGGSIRFPAHCCGILGHKPSHNLVSLDGHVPGGWHGALSPPADLPVAGPLARSARDLRTAIGALREREIPGARHIRLADYRVGYVDEPECAPVAERLSRAGAQVSRGWPEGVDPALQFRTYRHLLDTYLRAVMGSDGPPDDHALWYHHMREAARLRTAWRDYFRTHDAFLMPVAFTRAFPHDHSPRDWRTLGYTGRVIQTTNGPHSYDDLLYWFAPASLVGLPSTVAPIDVQILAPIHEDFTSIHLAQLLTE